LYFSHVVEVVPLLSSLNVSQPSLWLSHNIELNILVIIEEKGVGSRQHSLAGSQH
jgi:hypothetical protein